MFFFFNKDPVKGCKLLNCTFRHVCKRCYKSGHGKSHVDSGPPPPRPLQGGKLTNINVALWDRLLICYPDGDFVVKGLKEGFTLGFVGEAVTTKGKNAKSVRGNLAAAKDKVQRELQLGISSPGG